MSDQRSNGIAPTLDMMVKVAASLNKDTKLVTGMVVIESTQPHIMARVPFKYDAFSDELKLADEVNSPPWRTLVKALVRYHAHVFETATDNLVERVDELLSPAPVVLPPIAAPGGEQSH